MANIEVLREQHKRIYKEQLFRVFNDPDYQREWNKTLKGYTIQIIQNKHRLEAINILSYAFSALSGAILQRIFETSTKQAFAVQQPIVDQLIKTGTGFVILDPNGYVCSVYHYLDAIERGLIKYDSSNYSPKMSQMLSKLRKSNGYPQEHDIKYGQYINFGASATRPDLYGKGLHRMVTFMVTGVTCSIGYKKGFYIAVHPKTIHMVQRRKQWNGNLVTEHLLGKYTFEDGTTVNDILDRLQQKYEWKDIHKMRNMILTSIIVDYDKIRRQYNVPIKEIAKTVWKDRYENWMNRKQIKQFRVRSNI